MRSRKKIQFFKAFLVVLFFAIGASAQVSMPYGISGIVFMSDGITQAPEGTHFNVTDTTNGNSIEGTTGGPPGQSGHYSVPVSGEAGDEIVIRAWNETHYSTKTVTLSGDLTGIDLILNTLRSDQIAMDTAFNEKNDVSKISSSGGGIGGSISDENHNNIEVREKYDLNIFKNKVTSYRYTHENNPILFINITGNINSSEITTAVEVLRTPSSLVTSPVPGTVYRNINIWVGTSGFAVPQNIMDASIKFRVENKWLESNNFSAVDIALYHYHENSWRRLDTDFTGSDDSYTTYEAKTDFFSHFAIAGTENAGNKIAESTFVPAAATTTSLSTPETIEKTGGFEIITVLATLIFMHVYRRKM